MDVKILQDDRQKTTRAAGNTILLGQDFFALSVEHRAAVLLHELGHVAGQHSAVRAAELVVLLAVNLVVALVQDPFLSAGVMLASVFAFRHQCREQEHAADQFAVDHGIEPQILLAALVKMGAGEHESGFSLHPPLAERARRLGR